MTDQKSDEPYVKIEDSKEDLEFWINKDFIDEKLREKLKTSNALILPDEGFRDRKDIHFPVGTTELFNYLEKQKNEEFIPEICFGDDDYKELALHHDLITIGTFLATNVGLPLLVSHIYDYLKTKWGKLSNKNVKIKLIEQDGKKVRKLTYEGPAEDFNKHVLKALKEGKK